MFDKLIQLAKVFILWRIDDRIRKSYESNAVKVIGTHSGVIRGVSCPEVRIFID